MIARSSKRCLVCLTTVTLGAVVACPVARAQPAAPGARRDSAAPSSESRNEARERFERGIDLFQQGDYAGALAEFKRAEELAPYGVVTYNLGLTYAALGRPVEAADTMTRVIQNPGTLSSERLERARAVQREQAARIAEVAVECNVEGAAVDVDGVETGRTPLVKPLRVKGGPHRIGVVSAGYAPSRKEIDAASGARTAVRFELVATEQRLAHVVVRSKLPGAQVFVDGEGVGVTPLASSVTLLPGNHSFEVRRTGYVTARNDLTLGDGAAAEVHLDPEEDLQAVREHGGMLDLAISETEAVVSVDGASHGPYLGALRLAPGPHMVRIERGGFLPVDRTVTIDAGHTTLARVDLEPTPDTRARYVSKAKTMRTLGWVGVVAGAVVAGAGTGYLVWNKGKKDDARDAIDQHNATTVRGSGGKCDPSIDIDAAACDAEARSLQGRYDSAASRDIVGYIGIGVGGAALAAGAVLLIVGDDPSRYDKKPKETLAVVPLSLGPGGAVFGYRGSF